MRAIIAAPLQSSVIVLANPAEAEPRVMPLADLMSVGRLGYPYPGEPIRLYDPVASAGRNTQLQRTPEGLVVQDMGSSNPTMLNGRVVRRERPLLRVGDEVQVGFSLLRFEHTLPGEHWATGARHLLDAILAAPPDDRPRRVLADWLIGRGDPRGEFIACQLAGTRAATERANELLALHELAWVAPLPVPVESWTFERGFLTTVRVRDVAGAQVLRTHHPLTTIDPLAPARHRPFPSG